MQSLQYTFYTGSGTRGQGHFPKVSGSVLPSSLFTQDSPQHQPLRYITDGQAGFNWLVFIGDVRKK